MNPATAGKFSCFLPIFLEAFLAKTTSTAKNYKMLRAVREI
jgi:hypothetical protein